MPKITKKNTNESIESSKISINKSYDNDSSNMPDDDSDCSDGEIQRLDKSNKNMDISGEEYLKTVIFNKISQYVQLDTILQNKTFEFKKETDSIKTMKNNLEEFLCQYLEKVGEESISFGANKSIVKTVSQTKAPPKMEDIVKSLLDGFKKHHLTDNNDDTKKIINELVNSIDEKREIKTKKYIKYVGREDPNKDEKNKLKEKKKAEKSNIVKKK